MTDYYVRYGFGSDVEKLRELFLESSDDCTKSLSVFIKHDICFARELGERLGSHIHPESPIFYSLSCNPKLLEKAIKWINGLESGIEITLEKRVFLGGMVKLETSYIGYSPRVLLSDYKYGDDTTFLNTDSPDLEKYKYLPISRCAVKIDVKSDVLMAKAFIEYLVMITLRTLDINEETPKFVDPKLSIKKAITDASNRWFGGHAIYNKRVDGQKKFLTYQQLEKCLNVENMEKAIEDNKDSIKSKIRGYSGTYTYYDSIRSNYIIDMVIGG